MDNNKLRELFHDHISAQEPAYEQTTPRAMENQYMRQSPTRGTTETLITVSGVSTRSNDNKRTMPPYRYCNGNHPNDEGMQYQTAEARKQRLEGLLHLSKTRSQGERMCCDQNKFLRWKK